MVSFRWGHLLGQAWRSLFGTRNTHRRLTAHRLTVLVVFWILFIPHQIVSWACLVLDNILFPRWRRTPVEKPLFITGLFRSGTTFLHRVLSADSKHFTAYKTWEIYLAPSIVQKKLLAVWRRIDALFGSPAYRLLRGFDRRHLGKVQFHKVGLWKEEEDEGLLLFLWDSLFTWFFFPDFRGIADYHFPEERIPPERRKRRWRFYRSCIRRHLYCHPDSPIYLSKNPAFTPQLAGLKETFPDARLVLMVRDPRRVLVSQAAWFSFVWDYFASPLEPFPFRRELFDMTRYWYTYPFAQLETWDPGDYRIVEYRNLIREPMKAIRDLYAHFGLEWDADLAVILERESRRTDEYASARKLGTAEVGYDETEILEKFDEIFRRFDFSEPR